MMRPSTRRASRSPTRAFSRSASSSRLEAKTETPRSRQASSTARRTLPAKGLLSRSISTPTVALRWSSRRRLLAAASGR